MSLESLGIEGDGGSMGMSPEQAEKLAEQFRENARQIKAQKKDEKKHKAKDDKLVDILTKFIKSSKNSGLVAIIIRLLQENIPPAFILAIILLTHRELQIESGIILSLPSGSGEIPSTMSIEETKLRNQEITIKLWTETIITAALENPYKIIRNIKDQDLQIKSTAIQLMAFVLRDYFQNELQIEKDFEEIRAFSNFSLQGIITKVEERLEQMQIGEGN